VFEGSGQVRIGESTHLVCAGDLFAVPSWCPVSVAADTSLDAFRFSDEPVYEALGLSRTEVQCGP